MRLEHLYRLSFGYEAQWAVPAPDGAEHGFGLAVGRCEGALTGRFRGANHRRLQSDGLYLPDMQGMIETDDGAIVMVDCRGRGRIRDDGVFEVVATATHLSDDDRYRRLNDVVCAVDGEGSGDAPELVLDVYELVWEAIAE